MNWQPHVTVASIAQREDGRLLFVEEQTRDGLVINQPAGHWEDGETLTEAVIRETLEETGHHFQPDSLVGIYSWKVPGREATYLRFCFAGKITGHDADRPLDDGIERALWLNSEELAAQAGRHRSPLVERCVSDFLTEQRHPLSLIHALSS